MPHAILLTFSFNPKEESSRQNGKGEKADFRFEFLDILIAMIVAGPSMPACVVGPLLF
ncbi:hypothetical protein R0I01_14995 [Bacillus pumilus]|nr:hypothetical protein R0I01_14995 [Bacillus pumilus]